MITNAYQEGLDLAMLCSFGIKALCFVVPYLAHTAVLAVTMTDRHPTLD